MRCHYCNSNVGPFYPIRIVEKNADRLEIELVYSACHSCRFTRASFLHPAYIEDDQVVPASEAELTVISQSRDLPVASSAIQSAEPSCAREQGPERIAIDLLHDNPYQPRDSMEETSLQQLSETI